MPITLSSKMMNNTVQLICSDSLFLLARNLKHLLYFHDIIYFGEIHVSFAKYKSFEMYDENFGEGVYFCLFGYISVFATVVTV